MEVQMNYEELKKIACTDGWDGVMEYLKNKYPHLQLYSISKEWILDKKYILKSRGEMGDLIVYWE